MTETFEIYFSDLNEDAQKRYLEFIEAEDESDINADIIPIALVDVEKNDDFDV